MLSQIRQVRQEGLMSLPTQCKNDPLFPFKWTMLDFLFEFILQQKKGNWPTFRKKTPYNFKWTLVFIPLLIHKSAFTLIFICFNLFHKMNTSWPFSQMKINIWKKIYSFHLADRNPGWGIMSILLLSQWLLLKMVKASFPDMKWERN